MSVCDEVDGDSACGDSSGECTADTAMHNHVHNHVEEPSSKSNKQAQHDCESSTTWNSVHQGQLPRGVVKSQARENIASLDTISL